MNFPSETQLVLASTSPRRKELLTTLRLPFQVMHPDFAEVLAPGEIPTAYVQRNASGKALWVAENRLTPKPSHDYIVIGSDTIVVLDDEVLEKPTDVEDAVRMLKKLSNRTHTVHTGLFMAHVANDLQILASKCDAFTSHVMFKKLTEEEIRSYIATGEPMDKAGSYAVQGLGSYMVASIQGSYTNVMGLPLTDTFEWLASFSKRKAFF